MSDQPDYSEERSRTADITIYSITYPVAFEENIQILRCLTVLVIIKETLINGVFAVRLWTITAVEAFLSQSL